MDDKRAYDRRYYHEKVDKTRKYQLAQERRKLIQQKIKDYLTEHPCIDCGEPDPIVLEFDHVTDDKVANISDMVAHGCGLEKIHKEIAKCVVRCANCHRRVTYFRRNTQSVA